MYLGHILKLVTLEYRAMKLTLILLIGRLGRQSHYILPITVLLLVSLERNCMPSTNRNIGV